MAIVRTVIRIPSQDASYAVASDLSPAAVVTLYAAQIPGIGSMTSTVEETTGPNGDERVITFSPRAGNKG